MHFGFFLGANQSDFKVVRKPDPNFDYKLVNLKNVRVPGFVVGFVADYAYVSNIHFRFCPNFAFQDRQLEYTFQGGPDSLVKFTKLVSTTVVEFPLFVKFRTNRIGNFAAYAIGGGKYIRDFSSNKTDDLTADKDILVLVNKHMFAAEFGGGADFFLPYFKFGIELKMGIGFNDILIHDNTRFTRPLDGLFAKGYTLTFTFED